MRVADYDDVSLLSFSQLLPLVVVLMVVVLPSITNGVHNIRADNERSLGEILDRPVVVASYAPGRPSCSSWPPGRTQPMDLREA